MRTKPQRKRCKLCKRLIWAFVFDYHLYSHEHVHEYRKGKGSVDICVCGKFRHNEKAGEPVVEVKP